MGSFNSLRAPAPTPKGPAPKIVARRIGTWFRKEALPLPWRTTRDPYRIWVAEVLLQQTRVPVARRYYLRFLRAFPTLSALARAPREKVLKAWEGAGYYARARNLHESARKILRERHGRFPTASGELAQLPGFGPYISRSVAALAFQEPTLALDANGIRVLSRVYRIEEPAGSRAWRRLMEPVVARLPTSGVAPRELNEGLMELGERVCLPREPRCPACPLRGICLAWRELPEPGSLPRRRAPVARPHVVAAVGVLLRPPGRVLVGRRPEGGLLGGFWELPGGKLEPGESPAHAVLREFREETGRAPRIVRKLGVVEHQYSHFRVTLHVYELRDAPGTAGAHPTGSRIPPPFRWVTGRELLRLPLPGATRKMLPWILPRLAGARRDLKGGPPPARRASRGSGSRRGRSPA